MFKIYTLTDPNSNLVRYVGRTTEKLYNRLSKHINEREKAKNHRCHWINKLYKMGLKPIIELIDECDTHNECIFLEKYWISQFKNWGFNLVNETDGGEGSFGYKHTEETKNKMKVTHELKRSLSPPKRIKLTRKEVGKRNGELASIPVLQYDLEGNFIKRWNSATEAANFYGVSNSNITNCTSNRISTSLGFIWKKQMSDIIENKIIPSIVYSNKLKIKVTNKIINEIFELKSQLECVEFLKISKYYIQKISQGLLIHKKYLIEYV